jgi:hypothetical protein
MVIQSIREFNHSVPFRPYEIWTVSGERFAVPHPDFLSISPKGTFVIIFDRDERPHHVSTIMIERASPIPAKSRKRAKRSE